MKGVADRACNDTTRARPRAAAAAASEHAFANDGDDEVVEVAAPRRRKRARYVDPMRTRGVPRRQGARQRRACSPTRLDVSTDGEAVALWR